MREEAGRKANIGHLARAGMSLAGMAAVAMAQSNITITERPVLIEHDPMMGLDESGHIPVQVDGLLPMGDASFSPSVEEFVCSSLMALLPPMYVCQLKEDRSMILVVHESGRRVEIPVQTVKEMMADAQNDMAIRLKLAQYYAAQNGQAQPMKADQDALAQANAKRERKAAKRKELLCRTT